MVSRKPFSREESGEDKHRLEFEHTGFRFREHRKYQGHLSDLSINETGNHRLGYRWSRASEKDQEGFHIGHPLFFRYGIYTLWESSCGGIEGTIAESHRFFKGERMRFHRGRL